MKEWEFKLVWIFGLALCAGLIIMCKVTRLDALALLLSIIVLGSLSLLKDEKGRNIYDYIRTRLK